MFFVSCQAVSCIALHLQWLMLLAVIGLHNMQHLLSYVCCFVSFTGCELDSWSAPSYLTVRCCHVAHWCLCLLTAPVMSSHQSTLPYNLYCVGGDVKHCTVHFNLSVIMLSQLPSPECGTVCLHWQCLLVHFARNSSKSCFFCLTDLTCHSNVPQLPPVSQTAISLISLTV